MIRYRLGQFLRSLANRVDPPAPSYADFVEDLRREVMAEYNKPLTQADKDLIASTLRPNPQRPFTRPGNIGAAHESPDIERARRVPVINRKAVLRSVS